MKRNLHRILFVTSTAALGALLVTGCGGGQELESTQSRVAELSNKLAQAESRIGDWERTTQTALTNLALAGADFASLSNRYVKLKGQLAEAEGRGSIAEAKCGQQAARIVELEAQQAETVTLINQLREENARTATKASEAQKQITEANGRVQAATNEREILKARIAEMEKQINNPEWLRAQLSRSRAAAKGETPAKPAAVATPLKKEPAELTASPRGEAAMASNAYEPSYARMRLPAPKAPLEMMPDGSVRPVGKQGSPAAK